MLILGIETSCDETSAALVEVYPPKFPKKILAGFRVLSNVVASQVDIHKQYGGVVPEVAARSHVVRILPVVERVFQQVNSKFEIRNSKFVDLIAVTAGPGLISALSVGVETARYLGYAWGVPVIATNHLAGHLYSALLPAQRNSKLQIQNHKQITNPKSQILFPALGLIVSGGHTELVFVKNYGQHKLIGETQDDAAGEAFDKIAKLLGLPYPGGPELARLAEKGSSHAYDFPRGMIGSKDFNFSFSGLKTSLLYFTKSKNRKIKKSQFPDICASVEAAIVDVLVIKTVAAAKKYRVKTVLLGGGVAANKSLRKKLGAALKKDASRSMLHVPRLEYCTDNAAMIAAAGFITYKRHGASRLDHLSVNPHLPLR